MITTVPLAVEPCSGCYNSLRVECGANAEPVSLGASDNAVSASHQREADAMSLVTGNAYPRESGSAQKNGWPAYPNDYPESWL